MIIETDSDSYILEKLVEGVRLSSIDDVSGAIHLAVCMAEYDQPILSSEIAVWTEQQTTTAYSLTTNNCIHFAYAFGRRFIANSMFSGGVLGFGQRAMAFVNSMNPMYHMVTATAN